MNWEKFVFTKAYNLTKNLTKNVQN